MEHFKSENEEKFTEQCAKCPIHCPSQHDQLNLEKSELEKQKQILETELLQNTKSALIFSSTNLNESDEKCVLILDINTLKATISEMKKEIQQNSAKLQQNSAKLQQNSAQLQQNSAKLQQISSEIQQQSAEILDMNRSVAILNSDFAYMMKKVNTVAAVSFRMKIEDLIKKRYNNIDSKHLLDLEQYFSSLVHLDAEKHFKIDIDEMEMWVKGVFGGKETFVDTYKFNSQAKLSTIHLNKATLNEIIALARVDEKTVDQDQ